MSGKNWLWTAVEAILWYIFICFFIYVLENDINLYLAALVLLILAYAAAVACPWFRATESWKTIDQEGEEGLSKEELPPST